MKKLFLCMVLVMFASTAYAGIVSYDQITSTSTIGEINDSFNTIYDEFNGSVDSSNIEDGSLTASDFADAISPRVRDSELLGDFTYSGQLPSTSSSLTTTISAGTSYVNGYRLVTSSTSKTFTASKDTWVYIDQNGAFQYEVVNNNASQPDDPANSLLLAKVVTDSNNITSVSDERTTAPPGIRTYQDYRQGLFVRYKDADEITISEGEIDLGSSGRLRRNSSTTDVGWGNIDTGSEANDQGYYVWAYPNSSNSTTVSFAISLSSEDATGISDERLIGWFYNDAVGDISKDAVGCYKGDGSGSFNSIGRAEAADIATSSNAYTEMAGTEINFYSSGNPVSIAFDAPIRADTETAYIAIYVDSVEVISTACKNGTNAPVPVNLKYWTSDLGGGFHNVEVYWKTSANTIYQDGDTYGKRTLTVTEE